MAIKNWEKIGFASAGGAWENTSEKRRGNRRIIIDNHGNGWIVIKQVHTSTSGTNDAILFRTKGNSQKDKYKATSFAKKWMRKHPNG